MLKAPMNLLAIVNEFMKMFTEAFPDMIIKTTDDGKHVTITSE